MTELLIRLFIKEKEQTAKPSVRQAYGVMAGIVCIAANILLSAAKFAIGALSGSLAIQADAVNNLSDVGSSAVMIFGAKAANKPADREHPYGHARMEYVVSFGIAFLILTVGASLAKESIGKILVPEPVEYSIAMLAVLAVSILIKLWMGSFTARIGKRINSKTMSAASADSLCDVIATGTILASSLVGYFLHVNLDGYMGLAAALFVLWSGIGIIRDTIGPMLGEAPDKELLQKLTKRIMSYEGIIGLHDILLHSYGPGRYMASAHAEVRSDCDLVAIHEIIDRAEREIGAEMGILLTLHLDPLEVDNQKLIAVRSRVADVIMGLEENVMFHDFRMVSGENSTNLIFDIVVPPGMTAEKIALAKKKIAEGAAALDPAYHCVITVDFDYIGNL